MWAAVTYTDEAVSVVLSVFLVVLLLVSELQGELHEVLILLAHGLGPLCCAAVHDEGGSWRDCDVGNGRRVRVAESPRNKERLNRGYYYVKDREVRT